jgi:undecaprenyl-diphosphatase
MMLLRPMQSAVAQRSWPAMAALVLLWLGMWLLGGSGSRLDQWLLSRLYVGGAGVPTAIAAALTEFGGWKILIAASLVAAFLLYLRSSSRKALLLLFICLSGRLLVDLQKVTIGRLRPETEHLVDVHTMSFPSGHAANAAMTYLALALLLSGRPGVIVAALLFAVAIGTTRIMLGVHWPSDVIGGLAFGLFWVLLLVGHAVSSSSGDRVHRAREDEH